MNEDLTCRRHKEPKIRLSFRALFGAIFELKESDVAVSMNVSSVECFTKPFHIKEKKN